MNDEGYEQLVQASWRRALTREEEAELQSHLAACPHLQQAWEIEQTLTHTLQRLPIAPISSNFTARVLQAIDRESAPARRGLLRRPWLRSWLPRLASIGAGAGIVITSVHNYRMHTRTEAINIVASASGMTASLPSPAVLEDFDVIHQLHSAPAFGDEDLVAVLSK